MPNLSMQSLRRAHFPRWLPLLCLLWGAASADSITITRVGNNDWTCADDQGTRLSGHTRVDKAIEACANRSLSDGLEYRVIPAEYRVIATIDAVETGFTLNWTAPTHNEDGTLITDSLTYTVYQDGVAIASVDALTYTVENLSNGTYVFTVTATDQASDESQPSGERVFSP